MSAIATARQVCRAADSQQAQSRVAWARAGPRDRCDLDHTIVAWPGVAVISSLPAHALLPIVHLSSELGGAAGARSLTSATALGVCSPAQMTRSASAFGLHRRRPTPHPSSCQSATPVDRQPRPERRRRGAPRDWPDAGPVRSERTDVLPHESGAVVSSRRTPLCVLAADEKQVFRPDGQTDRRVGLAAMREIGEEQVACHAAVETRIHAAGGLKAAVRIAPASANLQRTGLLRRVVCCRRPGPSNAGVFDGGSTYARVARGSLVVNAEASLDGLVSDGPAPGRGCPLTKNRQRALRETRELLPPLRVQAGRAAPASIDTRLSSGRESASSRLILRETVLASIASGSRVGGQA